MHHDGPSRAPDSGAYRHPLSGRSQLLGNPRFFRLRQTRDLYYVDPGLEMQIPPEQRYIAKLDTYEWNLYNRTTHFYVSCFLAIATNRFTRAVMVSLKFIIASAALCFSSSIICLSNTIS